MQSPAQILNQIIACLAVVRSHVVLLGLQNSFQLFNQLLLIAKHFVQFRVPLWILQYFHCSRILANCLSPPEPVCLAELILVQIRCVNALDVDLRLKFARVLISLIGEFLNSAVNCVFLE